jgi:hypothetical protein
MTGRAGKEVLRVVLLAHAVIWVAWLIYAFGVAPVLPERDWVYLREVGKSFLAGDWASLYGERKIGEGTMLFRYPPFVLYALALLAAVPPKTAYALICVVQLLAALSTVLLLFRIRKPRDADLVIAAVFGSAALAHVIVSGQSSAVLALTIAAAGLCWSSGRNVLAGVCVGLLAWKPNWLPVLGLATVWRGGIRAGAASGMVVVGLMLSTLPLGAGVWHDFLTITTQSSEIETRLLAYREITLLASLRSILAWGAATMIIWAVLGTLLAGLAIHALRDARPIGRSIAVLTLLALVVNPYANFYDGFVLVIPGVLWYAHRNDYSERAWWSIGAWLAAYWLWDMAVFYYSSFVPAFDSPRLSAAGILLTGWLVTEAVAGVPNPRPRMP